MKKNIIAFIVLAAFAVLSACSVPPDEKINESKPYYSFTDSVGNKIVLYEKPKKTAVLFSSYADIWKLSDGEIAVTVGESVERGIADDTVLLVDGGAGKAIDSELLLSYEPDFVIASADIPSQVNADELMNASGIPAALFEVECFEEYLDMLKICCDINQSENGYYRYGESVKQSIDTVLEDSNYDGVDILFIRSGSKYSSAKAKTKENNFVCRMLYELGTYNIAEKADVLLDGLSIEEIILSDPDYIFISTMGDEDAAKKYINSVLSDEKWQTLTAVKNGNYCFLPKDLFQFKPNAKWDEAYKYLAEKLDEVKK